MLKKFPDQILFTKSTPVADIKEGIEIAEYLKQEIRSLTWGRCAGLAAPQIGINKRVFIALDIVYINPEILSASPLKKKFKEGCYSLIKDAVYDVERPMSIKVKYISNTNKIKEVFLVGLNAQVFQHEFDHLEGRLCSGNN